jgi:hypothetical protein
MQVNATLIAAQQAAREARDRFQTSHFAPAGQGAAFTAALEKEGFAPLTLKQTAPASASQAPPRTAPQAGPDAAPLSRPGSWLDIKV